MRSAQYTCSLSFHKLTKRQGEVFLLQFRFDAQYPISSPAVQVADYDLLVWPVLISFLHASL